MTCIKSGIGPRPLSLRQVVERPHGGSVQDVQQHAGVTVEGREPRQWPLIRPSIFQGIALESGGLLGGEEVLRPGGARQTHCGGRRSRRVPGSWTDGPVRVGTRGGWPVDDADADDEVDIVGPVGGRSRRAASWSRPTERSKTLGGGPQPVSGLQSTSCFSSAGAAALVQMWGGAWRGMRPGMRPGWPTGGNSVAGSEQRAVSRELPHRREPAYGLCGIARSGGLRRRRRFQGYGWMDERMPVAWAAKRPFGSRSRYILNSAAASAI